MGKRTKHVIVHSSITPEQRDEMGAILDRVAGMAIERTGDITIEVGGKRYVFSDQGGAHSAGSVQRDGGTEVVQSTSAYRAELVVEVSDEGLRQVDAQGPGTEFTLKSLARDSWADLSDVEQRNAGKRFRKSLEKKHPGAFESWKTSDNERHYRRR
jgi:hypothetical protein